MAAATARNPARSCAPRSERAGPAADHPDPVADGGEPDQAGNLQATRIDVNEVAFTKAQVDFTRTGRRLDFKDAAIWPARLHPRRVHRSRGRADISAPSCRPTGSTTPSPRCRFVRAASRRRTSTQGLFAVNFRVSGQATAPVLTVNPLSAVAPAFCAAVRAAGGRDGLTPLRVGPMGRGTPSAFRATLSAPPDSTARSGRAASAERELDSTPSRGQIAGRERRARR